MYIYDKSFFYNSIIKLNEEKIIEVISNKEEYYDFFSIPKKNGYREICAIRKSSILYEVQIGLKEYFSSFSISNAAKGFIKNNSYFDFLNPHVNKKYYLRIDIKDFFGSITKELIFDKLNAYCKFEDIVNYMVDLTTMDGKLPQGAVTSPILSNIVFTKIDQRIIKYCQSLINVFEDDEQKVNDVIYTRYADDLLFSSDFLDFKNNAYFSYIIKKILNENGFKINYEKMKYGYNQMVLSGFVVGENIHLSRKKMNELNSLLYYFDKRETLTNKKYRPNLNKITDNDLITNINSLKIGEKNGKNIRFENITDLINYLSGYRAFLISVGKVNINFDKQKEQNCNKINKIEKLIDELARKYLV